MSFADSVPIRRIYRTWGDDDKAKIVAEARRIKAEKPNISSDLSLIKKAQQILPADKQRHITTVNTPAYQWFREGIRKAASSKSVDSPQPEQPKDLATTAEATPLPSIPSQAPPLPAIKPGPDPSPDETPDVTTIQILGVLVDVMREAHDRMGRLEAGTLTHLGKLLEQLNWQNERLKKIPTAPSTNGYSHAIDLSRPLEAIRQEIRSQNVKLDQIHSATANLAAAMNSLDRRLGYLKIGVAPPSEPEPSPDPVKETRKPKVLILGIDTGHWWGPIKNALEKRCSALDFRLVSGEPKPYGDFDLVITTKKVPEFWRLKAQSVVPKEKLSHASGGPDDIIRHISSKLDKFELQSS